MNYLLILTYLITFIDGFMPLKILNCCYNSKYFNTDYYLNKLDTIPRLKHKTNMNIQFDDIVISICNNNIKKIIMPTTEDFLYIYNSNNNTYYYDDINEIKHILHIIKFFNKTKIIKIPDYYRFFYNIKNNLYNK